VAPAAQTVGAAQTPAKRTGDENNNGGTRRRHDSKRGRPRRKIDCRVKRRIEERVDRREVWHCVRRFDRATRPSVKFGPL
jgi:hypothetical protein